MRFIILLLALVPLVELYVLLRVGTAIGALPTIFLVVFTAILGALLVRVQGVATVLRVRKHLEAGELPAQELLEGIILLLAGLLLLVPGLLTDALGFLLLVPRLRRALAKNLLLRGASRGLRPPGQEFGSARIIEGQFERRDDKPWDNPWR